LQRALSFVFSQHSAELAALCVIPEALPWQRFLVPEGEMQAKEDERAGLVEKVKYEGKYRRLQEQAKALKLKYDSVASKNAALQQMSGAEGAASAAGAEGTAPAKDEEYKATIAAR
jgi:hypothetical protein